MSECCETADSKHEPSHTHHHYLTNTQRRTDHSANSVMAWALRRQGSPGLDALWHRRRRTVAYYAIRLLWTYMFCWVYYTRTWWENVLNMSQFTMIWSNISVLYGTPAPTGFGDSHTWSLNIKTMANNLTLWQTLSKHMIARKPEVIKDRSTRSKELQDE